MLGRTQAEGRIGYLRGLLGRLSGEAGSNQDAGVARRESLAWELRRPNAVTWGLKSLTPGFKFDGQA